VVSTTYAGSAIAPVYVHTSEGRKRTGRSPKVLAKIVIYVPEADLLAAGLPHRPVRDEQDGPSSSSPKVEKIFGDVGSTLSFAEHHCEYINDVTVDDMVVAEGASHGATIAERRSGGAE